MDLALVVTDPNTCGILKSGIDGDILDNSAEAGAVDLNTCGIGVGIPAFFTKSCCGSLGRIDGEVADGSLDTLDLKRAYEGRGLSLTVDDNGDFDLAAVDLDLFGKGGAFCNGDECCTGAESLSGGKSCLDGGCRDTVELDCRVGDRESCICCREDSHSIGSSAVGDIGNGSCILVVVDLAVTEGDGAAGYERAVDIDCSRRSAVELVACDDDRRSLVADTHYIAAVSCGELVVENIDGAAVDLHCALAFAAELTVLDDILDGRCCRS